MLHFSPPPEPIAHQVAQVRSPTPNKESNRFLVAAITEGIPEKVESDLRSLMQSLSTVEITPDSIIAQVGPVKPDSRPLPKPTDPAPVPPKPSSTKGLPLNVKADRQEYNVKTQIFTATGNVVVVYQQSELKADKVELNLKTQQAVADGNIFFTRGDQKLRGSRLEYNYAKVQGTLADASGSINFGTLNNPQPSQLPADTASSSQTISIGNDTPDKNPGKGLRRLGFRAALLKLDGDRWTAEKLRITNDPFSPPEMELITDRATLSPISPTQDRLEAIAPTLVFDGVFSLPVPINTLTLDRFQRSFPLLVGYDRTDRGGLFYQQDFDLISQPDLSFRVSPQVFVQKGLQGGNIFDSGLFGFVAKLESILPDDQYLAGRATISSLNPNDFSNSFRASLLYNRPIFGDHQLSLQYGYRERVFNGSLGFQDIRNTIGFNIFSPNRVLGDTGINFSYQAGMQYINAERGDIQPTTVNGLGRLQTAVTFSRGVPLWRGQPLPAEKETGLKYSPEPIVPGVDAVVGVTGAYSYYSVGASQAYLSGTLGISAVLGNFSKPFLDYTKINISYTQGLVSGESPFLFDRIADRQSVTAGIQQQIYGPIRLGVQQTWNPGTGKVIDSSYSLEYSRRTYAVVIRYNPTREIGEILLRISDFNWNNPPSNVTTVEGGIERREP
jgi:lipopolysaccharide export system protein LptA